MSNDNTFHYTYSAPENQEVLNIRKKYLPREESMLEELKRLDNLVHSAGTLEALSLGIGGCLLFGLGLCFRLEVLGSVTWPGILLGLAGTAGMIFAYPTYRNLFKKTKQKHTPRILELTDQLSDHT